MANTRKRTNKGPANGLGENRATKSKVQNGNGALSAYEKRRSENGVSLLKMAPVLLDYASVLAMVLGGCCSNVYAYEQLLILNPRIGSALTFSQMLFITIQSLPSFLVWKRKQFFPSVKPRQVSISQWAVQVVLLTAGSLLNNWAFAYNVPLTVMIIFRSAGLVVSMFFGFFLMNKRYSAVQVACVLLVSSGVVISTLSKPSPPKPTSATEDVHSPEAAWNYFVGVSMQVISLLLMGILGVLQENTYKKYGPCWKEAVFYTHCLSLPVFVFLGSDIKQGLLSLGTKTATTSPLTSYLILAGNLVSQLICVSGVNRLSSQVSNVSTNLVLTTRKALSLCFSVWWFGNGWNTQLGIGALMVFVGSVLFSSGGNDKAKEGEKKL